MTAPSEAVPFADRVALVEAVSRSTLEIVDDREAPNPRAERVARLRAALVDTAGLDRIPEPAPLIPGVLYRDSLAWLYGAPGCGKSFAAIDMAGSVGTGETWQGYGPIKAGSVLYLVAEGVSGVRLRVRAWEAAAGRAMSDVSFLPVAVQAGDPAEWSALADLAQDLRPAMVIIDTQARVTVGMEENIAKDMGEFVARAEALRLATRACVLVVHHTGRGGEHMRGSIAMDGAATTMIRVEKSDEMVTLECAKQKDAAPFEPIKLRLVPVNESACLCLTDGARPSSVDSPALVRFRRAWWDSHETAFVGAGILVDTTGTSRASVYRYINALVRAHLAEAKGDGNARRFRLTVPPIAEPVS